MDLEDSTGDNTESGFPAQQTSDHQHLPSFEQSTREILRETSSSDIFQKTTVKIFNGILSTEDEQGHFSRVYNSTSEELRTNVTSGDAFVNELSASESYVFIVLCVILITAAIIIAAIITAIIIRCRHVRRKPYLRVSYASESELAAHKIETTLVPEDVLNRALASLYESLALDALNSNDPEAGIADLHRSTDNFAKETSDDAKAKLAASAGSLLNAHEEAMSYSLHRPKNNIHKSLPFLDEKIYKLAQNNPDNSDATEQLLDKSHPTDKENYSKKKHPNRYSMASFSDLKLTNNFLKDKDRVRKPDVNKSASNDRIWKNDVPVSSKIDNNDSETKQGGPKQTVPASKSTNPKNSEQELDNVFEPLLDETPPIDELGAPTKMPNAGGDGNLWLGSKSCDNLDLGSKKDRGHREKVLSDSKKDKSNNQKMNINSELALNGSRKRT